MRKPDPVSYVLAIMVAFMIFWTVIFWGALLNSLW